MHGWFVCPTVSMVTANNATGLEKAQFIDDNQKFISGLILITGIWLKIQRKNVVYVSTVYFPFSLVSYASP